MSGFVRGIKKVFKKVAKVVKKIALPALAIGAVVLTGGAAIGALPSLGTLAGSLGLSPALTGILTTAARGATIGALGSAVTGGNVLRGATSGLIAGGVMGGIGSALGGAGAAAAPNLAAPANLLPDVSTATAPLGFDTSGMGGAFFDAIGTSSPSAAGLGIGSALTAGGAAAAVPVAAAPVGAAVGGGGVLGFLNQNPILAGSLIQGIGSGLMAREQARAQEQERERRAANYGDMSGLYQAPAGIGAATYQNPNSRFIAPVYGPVVYDRATGEVRARG